ncbi:type VII secretion target [Stackebrandtia nassauensis]|uniref:Uncharacterized protein n=1 Tax=Stackebrandtia nassauensis (strain DSM 44728 / CIP 108903 / NRRL B-16338 / NBRC 102104 / LLR-40K-21) TaxID=446470 RepID=D3PZ25_STANL|nr:type VII secretion target [Stackebrandtia nassauensis]ADD45454.1 hypothetical protein Snas_5824 [Stackebrandtia nassauensis DSM 44728]
MNDGPPQVSVDLAGLRQIGEYHLRQLANHHNGAADKLAGVQYNKGGNLFKSAVAESGTYSAAFEKWLELYGLAQEIMKQTVTNLSDLSDAVIATADSFYEQDMSNAEKLAFDEEMNTYRYGDEEYRETGGVRGEGPTGGEPPAKPTDPPDPTDTTYMDDQIYTRDEQGDG